MIDELGMCITRLTFLGDGLTELGGVPTRGLFGDRPIFAEDEPSILTDAAAGAPKHTCTVNNTSR